MTKPDWKDAPEWASYLAMDRNGCWWWYEFKPTIFLNEDEWVKVGGRAEAFPSSNDDWRDTLEMRPDPTA